MIDRQTETLPAAVDERASVVLQDVMLKGDLSKLDPIDRVVYYRKVCESLGLNPFTRPFEFIVLNGKLTLYARKDCTEQLRDLNGVSVTPPVIDYTDDLVIVTVTATNKHGRTDADLGAVSIANLKGEAKANAIMKAITKAKRRVTLSICGLGWTDESEIESIPSAQAVEVDLETGEVKQPPRGFTPPASPGSAGQPDPLADDKPKVSAAETQRLIVIGKIQDRIDAEPFNAPAHEAAWVYKYAGIDGDWRDCTDKAQLSLLAACVIARSKGEPVEPCEAWLDANPDYVPAEARQ